MAKRPHMDRYALGDHAEFAKTVTDFDVYGFAGIVGDFYGVHVNEEYAKTTRFEEVKWGPGVQILDVTAPKPSLGGWWSMEGIQNVSDLFSDGKCLHLPSATGTTVWDIESRTQVAEFPSFMRGYYIGRVARWCPSGLT